MATVASTPTYAPAFAGPANSSSSFRPRPVRLADYRTFVSTLGAGLQTIPRMGYTRVTVDGVNMTTPGTVGTILQVSPDVV